MQRDGATLFPAERFAVNDRGDLVFTANTGGEAVRMYLLENGDFRLLAYRGEAPPPSAVSGAIVAWWDNNLALDNQGRVMALLATATASGTRCMRMGDGKRRPSSGKHNWTALRSHWEHLLGL